MQHTRLLYLSQEGKMLDNQMSALGFPSTALPTDYDTLKQRETNLVRNIYITLRTFFLYSTS